MDSITTILAAFATGAAAASKPTTEQSIKDAYAALKTYLQHRYSGIDINVLEKRPGSKPRQEVFAEELNDTEAKNDDGLIKLAQNLIDLIQQHDPAVIITTGVDLHKIREEYLKANRTAARDDDKSIEDGEFTGGIDIRNILAGKKR